LQQAITTAAQPRATFTANATAAAGAAADRQQLQGQRGRQGHHHHQQQQQRGLSIASFSSEFLGTPAILAVLPAHSLTYLDLTWSRGIDGAAMSAALAQLSRLQTLHLKGGSVVDDACLPGIAQLQHLTELRLCCSLSGMQRLQQLLAQPLPLCALELSLRGCDPSGVVLNMAQLKRLQELVMNAVLSESSQLPQQLQRLKLKMQPRSQLAPVTGLHQLQSLSLQVNCGDTAPLLSLAQLTGLQELSLQYNVSQVAAATASAWRQLPQLRDLTVFSWQCSAAQVHTVAAGLAACTNVTRLYLKIVPGLSYQAPEEHQQLHHRVAASVMQNVAGLTQLRSLQLHLECAQPEDALPLTALTVLTLLDLASAPLLPKQATWDLPVSALACHLKQLASLQLCCQLGEMACLAPIGQLKRLTMLRIPNTGDVTEQGLMLLTGLSQLQQLDLGEQKQLPGEVMDGFWATIRQQRSGS
jgi:Leucine-rich repeat (LRR) protein